VAQILRRPPDRRTPADISVVVGLFCEVVSACVRACVRAEQSRAGRGCC
jgi:hypothetical protein